MQHQAAFDGVGESAPSLPKIGAHRIELAQRGGVGDGQYDNTQTVNQLLAELSESGGGRLIIGPGIWATGPIRLHSGMELHLAAGAVVRFSRDYEAYDPIVTHFEGTPGLRARSPIDGENLEDVAITGLGVFDGGGEVWRPVKKAKTTAKQWRELVAGGGVLNATETIWWPTAAALQASIDAAEMFEPAGPGMERWAMVREYLRPTLLSLRGCRRVLLAGPTFQNSPAWCLHVWACQDVTVRQVTVRNPWYAQNGDGIDIDSSKNVLIEDSAFDVGDDAICLKSGKNQAGRDLGIPTEAVMIRNCTVWHGHGGVTIGSEMSGGVRGIRVSNLTLLGTDIGIRFKSTRGRGGVVEDVAMQGVRMLDIAGAAISFDMFYESAGDADAVEETVPVSEDTPIFRNISLDGVEVAGADIALSVRGLPEQPIHGIAVTGMHASARRGIQLEHVDNLTMSGVHLDVDTQPWLEIRECQNLQFEPVRIEPGPDSVWMQIAGARTRAIRCAVVGADPGEAVVSGGGDPAEIMLSAEERS